MNSCSIKTATNAERLLAALLESHSLKEAAERAGIGYSTARRLLSERPELRERLAALQEEATSAAVFAAMGLADVARDRLLRILTDEHVPPYVAVQAAKVALEYVQAVHEGEVLDEKIADIERLLNEQEGQRQQADLSYVPAPFRRPFSD